MPKAILPALASAIATYAVTGNYALALRAFVVTVLVSSVSKALTKKPKNPNSTSQVDAGALTVRQAIAPWQVVFGRSRVGGVLTFRHISADRKYWHMVITLACHRCQAVEEVWFNDEKLVIDSATGNVSGRYSKIALASTFATGVVPGSPHQVTVGGTVAGVFDVRVNLGRGGTPQMFDVSPAAPTHFQHYSRSGSTFTFHSANAGRQYDILYFTSSPTGGSWARIKTSLGDEAAGVQPFPDLLSESAGLWSSDHQQQGHTKLYIRLEANNAIFPTGVPQVTAVVKGALVYDPRSGLTEYSNNAALCIAHYLTESASGYGMAADYATEIDEDDLVAAANSCDEAVTVGDGGAEPRYTVNGTFVSSEQPKAVLERLLAACAGSLVSLGDKWHVNVGVYHAPTVTLNESHLAGLSTVQPMLSSRDDGNVNGVRGVFTNPNANWQPDDFPALASDTYLAEDNGERRWKDIDLTTFVTSHGQAQRLAKIDLLRVRQGLTEVAPFKLPAWQVVPGRSVARTDSQFGWSAKAFEVIDSEFIAAEDEESGVTLQARLTLQETAPEIYDWSTSEEQLEDFAPNTELPDPGDVPVPGLPAISEELYDTRDGRGVAAKAIVSYAQSTYPFGARYQLEYKLSAAAAWTVLAAVEVPNDFAGDVVQEILDLDPGTYNFRVLAIALSGARSEYATTSAVDITGLGASPAAPSGLSIQAGGGTARLKIDRHAALDVLRGGRILVRFCHEGVGSVSWEAAFSVGEVEGWPGDSTQIDVPLKPGTYLLKAEDSTGHESEAWAEISTKQASVLEFTSLGTVTFDSTFDGTYSGTVVVDGVLTLGGAGMFDDIPDLDAVSDLDGYGGISADGTCTLTTGLDLGSVTNVRLTSRLEGSVINLLDLIDDRTENIDDWVDFDGESFSGSSADAWLETRETDDDPAGAPVWSDWKRLDAAEFEARAFQFRARLTSVDAAYRPEVSVLRVTAEEVV